MKTRGPFDPSSREPFKVSRSKIDLFSECPRCAYLDLRLGVKRPSGPAFTLNNAVDELLKREFDIHRSNATAHPLLKRYGLDAVPLADERMSEWRDALRRGITFLHEPTNLLIRGGIDDVWVNPAGEFIIVDYKATSKKIGPSSEEVLYDSYKRQMVIYQWLFRQNGFAVSPVGYFVYVNGKSDADPVVEPISSGPTFFWWRRYQGGDRRRVAGTGPRSIVHGSEVAIHATSRR